MMKYISLIFLTLFLTAFLFDADAQTSPKKANVRPAKKVVKKIEEPFETASVEKMSQQCVRLETAEGNIDLEMFPESAPETVRNFLNLTALGAFDTTTFSRVVPDFVIQGGSSSTREKYVEAVSKRMNRNIPDEPNQIKHIRGIVSMAKSDEPNSASSSFFILVGIGGHLDGKFAAFGRVTSGMEVVNTISKMPVENEKPLNPVRLTKVSLIPCLAKATQD